MKYNFLYSLTAAAFFCLTAASPAYADAVSGNLPAAQDQQAPSYQQGTLEGTTFSNPWADYRMTFPEGTYFNPDSLVSYMSSYTGMDYEFAASLYGDMTLYPCINISYQDALIPLKECVQNLLDIYSEKDYSYTVKTGVWVGGHPFTHVQATSETTDIYIDNYLRVIDGKLMWICIKCPKEDDGAIAAVRQVVDSATTFSPSAEDVQ